MDHQYPIRIDDELWRQAKIKAATDRITLREVIEKLLVGWVDGKLRIPKEKK